MFVAGRVRAAAAAQLMLVQAVEQAGVPVADRAGGVWNLLSGAVQALVVRDVLDGPTLYRLLDPVVSALGPVVGTPSTGPVRLNTGSQTDSRRVLKRSGIGRR